MLDAFKYSVKFEQVDIINHFKNTSKNNFSKKIIGVDNMKSLQDGICYGLTNSFYIMLMQTKKRSMSLRHITLIKT
ncbi:hypothetical protein [Providencia stuartii]|uniref:hypothetical protein n=1 Tax=Providencia stuartii TaxID=588 RepID=UPI0027FBF365|nr:hypothetical protein [Providencia stuartii]MDQ5990409.1 hypothetical protein [Providencia stuartii]